MSDFRVLKASHSTPEGGDDFRRKAAAWSAFLRACHIGRARSFNPHARVLRIHVYLHRGERKELAVLQFRPAADSRVHRSIAVAEGVFVVPRGARVQPACR